MSGLRAGRSERLCQKEEANVAGAGERLSFRLSYSSGGNGSDFRRQRKRGKSGICWSGLLLIIVVLGWEQFANRGGIDAELDLLVRCVLCTAGVVWIVSTVLFSMREMVSYYTVFLCALLAFHSGQVLLHVIGMADIADVNRDIPLELLSSAVTLSTMGMVSFHFAGILAFWRQRGAWGNTASRSRSSEIDRLWLKGGDHALLAVGIPLLAVGTVPFVLQLREEVSIAWEWGYGGFFASPVLTGFAGGGKALGRVLAQFFVPGVFFSAASGKVSRPVKQLLLVTLLAVGVLRIAFGQRAHGTMLLFATLWYWHLMVKRLSPQMLIGIGALLIGIVFPGVGVVRGTPLGEWFASDGVAQVWRTLEAPVKLAMLEMGGTLRVVAVTAELIPGSFPYRLGESYLYAMSRIVPNVFWDIHPAVIHGDLGRWFTMTVSPETYAAGGGLGFSMIAEAYANFGRLGTPVVMGLVGYGVQRLSSWWEGREDLRAARVAFVAVLISSTIFWVRNGSDFFWRPFVIYGGVPYLVYRNVQSVLVRRKRRILRGRWESAERRLRDGDAGAWWVGGARR